MASRTHASTCRHWSKMPTAGALVTVDSAPIIHFLENRRSLADRFRSAYRLRLPDAIQLATAVATGSAALVTHDRDFSRVREIRILG
ncbi:hypothetical protein MYXO_01119 [Myxococcaceae bacterium]|nr:hypothetical protein MYXO_01119 [Myxococcaceae bacterium]